MQVYPLKDRCWVIQIFDSMRPKNSQIQNNPTTNLTILFNNQIHIIINALFSNSINFRSTIKILLESIITQNIEYIDIKVSELKSDISHDRKKVCTLIIYQKPILHFNELWILCIFQQQNIFLFRFLLRTQWIKMRLECKPDTNINTFFRSRYANYFAEYHYAI